MDAQIFLFLIKELDNTLHLVYCTTANVRIT